MAGFANQSCADWKTPEAGDYLKNLETGYLVITVICGVLVLITTIILGYEVVFIYRRRATWPQPGKTIWLLSLYTIFAYSSFVGVLVPRAADIGMMMATMYLAVSLYVFRRLLISYYGGTKKMMERLEGTELKRVFLPNTTVKKSSFKVTEVLVLQFTILQPLLVFTEAVIIADMQENVDNTVYLITTIIEMISTILAVTGLFLFFRFTLQHLAYAGIKAKFICLKLVIGLNGTQKMILLALGEKVPCASGLSHKDNATRIGGFLLIFEAFLISIIALIYYKRDQNLHLHPKHGGYTVEDSSDTSRIVSGSSSNVGSFEPTRYGATDEITNEDSVHTNGAFHIEPPKEKV